MQFFSRDDVTGAAEEKHQDLERLAREMKANPILAEFLRLRIDLEGSEAQQRGGEHGEMPFSRCRIQGMRSSPSLLYRSVGVIIAPGCPMVSSALNTAHYRRVGAVKHGSKYRNISGLPADIQVMGN